MADDTERLVVQLEGRISDFEKKMKQAERRGSRTYNKLQGDSRSATRRMERDMTRASGRINAALASTSTAVGALSSAFRVLTPVLGVAALAKAGTALRRVVGEMSALGKTARDGSLDVETLQGVQRGFARSANVSQQEVNASLGRFARRVGEAANGQGELNKFVEKYNIDLKDANGELKSQEQLLRDVADVIQRAGSDQERLAIAQAAFGDTGRRLAQTLAGGADEFDNMVRSAEDAGQVIDRDLIAQAEELDDRFDELGRTLGTAIKAGALEATVYLEPLLAGAESVVEAMKDVADQRSDLSDIFGSDEAARGILGDELFERLSGNLEEIGRNIGELRNLATATEGVEGQARGALQAFSDLLRQLRAAGETEAAAEMRAIAVALSQVVEDFRQGEISAAEFAQRLVDLDGRADEAVAGIEGIDESSLDGIKSQFGGLISLVELLVARVREVKAEAANTDTGGDTRGAQAQQTASGFVNQADAADEFICEQERRRQLTVEQISVEQEAARLRREAANEDVTLTEEQIAAQARLNVARRDALRDTGGADGGGGGGGGNVFEREVAAIRERIAETEAEAAALVMAAGSKREYGAAIEFALQKARLMTAAQRAGMEITPELEQAVNSLANAYVTAAERADEAAESLRRAEEQSERGAQALSNMFAGILTGSQDASDAMSALLQRIAQVQIKSALTGLFEGSGEGSIGQIVGSLLGFSGGGFTGAGGKNEPKGVVHGGEFVFSKKATKAIGVNNLEAAHSAAKGFASGGFVGAGGGQGGVGGNVNIEVIAPPGSEVKQERRQNESGGEDIKIMIDKAVSGLARDPRSDLNRALQGTFGISHTTRGR